MFSDSDHDNDDYDDPDLVYLKRLSKGEREALLRELNEDDARAALASQHKRSKQPSDDDAEQRRRERRHRHHQEHGSHHKRHADRLPRTDAARGDDAGRREWP